MKIIERVVSKRVDRTTRPHVLFGMYPDDIFSVFSQRAVRSNLAGAPWPVGEHAHLAKTTIDSSVQAYNEHAMLVCWFATIAAHNPNGVLTSDFPCEFLDNACYAAAWVDGAVTQTTNSAVRFIDSTPISEDVLLLLEVPLLKYKLPYGAETWQPGTHGLFQEIW